ncbi:MAG: DNA-processing protein DprA [Dehalococcoidia bacterium]|nr:DNA-processing protein DprA [Dehalococcoidia bacterium]
MTENLKYWLGFSMVPGIGPVRFGQLEKTFKTLEAAWQAETSDLRGAGLEDGIVRNIVQTRAKIDLDNEWAKLDKFGIRLINWHDSTYPARLKQIHDKPAVLFINGKLEPEDELCVSVVGARQPTIYGRQVAEEMSYTLASAHITVVSGLARGIDSIAHSAALSAGGRTLAVVGSGLDNIYPSENTSLARRIAENGAVISEYPPGTRPRPENFPRRNRILSGLCLGVLVVEAGESSGALITAQLAVEHNREVFAIPGSILSPGSAGTNKLIQDGAKLVRNVSDILEELNITSTTPHQMKLKAVLPETPAEAALFKHLGAEPVHVDELCRVSGLPAGDVGATLAMMELKGMVKQIGAMNFALARETPRRYTLSID